MPKAGDVPQFALLSGEAKHNGTSDGAAEAVGRRLAPVPGLAPASRSLEMSRHSACGSLTILWRSLL